MAYRITSTSNRCDPAGVLQPCEQRPNGLARKTGGGDDLRDRAGAIPDGGKDQLPLRCCRPGQRVILNWVLTAGCNIRGGALARPATPLIFAVLLPAPCGSALFPIFVGLVDRVHEAHDVPIILQAGTGI